MHITTTPFTEPDHNSLHYSQVAYENLVIDNKAQRDKIRNLEQEIVKLNKGK